ncbi:MAG: class I tRNA ligase family protein, partial [Bacteroidetes bacterium]|nr:class I tRNA ligase family protein [Bacteroidota bacterium]
LYTCLINIAKLGSPIAPFYMDRLFRDLNEITGQDNVSSVHLSEFSVYNESLVDKALEERMEIAQKLSSMVLSLRKKHNIKVRQPLSKILVPILDLNFQEQLEKVKDLILSEVNVKELHYLTETEGILVKKIRPNFKSIGPKYGKYMKAIAAAVTNFTQADIASIEIKKGHLLLLEGEKISLDITDFEISSEDIPGWLVASEGSYTVALDISITNELKEEGIARELVNRIQNLRKDNGFEVTDKIIVEVKSTEAINSAINNYLNYICTEILASSLKIVSETNSNNSREVELDEGVSTQISIEKIN